MDLSKLPKLSNTPTPPPAAATEAQSAPAPIAPEQRVAPAIADGGIGGVVWFNVVIAILLLFLGRDFARYGFARLRGQPYHTGVTWQVGDKAGTEVDYPDLQPYVMLTDAGLLFFGLAVLVEAALLAKFQLGRGVPRAVVMAAIALTAASTAFNLYVSARLMMDGTLPLFSGLAVAFGGYMIASEWQLLRPTTRPVKHIMGQ